MPNPSRETNFSGANADREVLIFPVQLTTCRIGNLTRLIHTLPVCVTIDPYNIILEYCIVLYCMEYIISYIAEIKNVFFFRNEARRFVIHLTEILSLYSISVV